MKEYIGQKLNDRYEIIEQIGTGGMSNVYKAFDLLGDKIVAIKVLKQEFSNDEEFLARFKNESKAIAYLSHPNIVKVYDVNFSKESQYIVMEYIDGITLKDYIIQEKELNWKEVVHFSTEILKALQHAHDKGIVHRDIKPHNIMILKNGNIKVMDFGIARFARGYIKTNSGKKTVGSVHYVSPEQAQGHFTDQKTDIYSLGIVLYEMLSGKLPFEADTAINVAIKQISAEPKRLREVNPNVPLGLEAIVIKAMQKVPSKRYHTASEMLLDINEFKENPDIEFGYDNLANHAENPYYQGVLKKSKQILEQRKLVSEVARKEERFDKNDEAISTAMPITLGIVLGFIITAIIGLVYFLIIKQPFARVPDITSPDLVGVDELEISSFLKKDSQFENLKISIIERTESEEFRVGLVFKQDPKSGRKIKANSTIEISISSGLSELIMPEIKNQKQMDAVKKLSQLGIKSKVESRSDDTIVSGNVIGTNIPAGTKLEKDEQVIVYVSTGPAEKKQKVPNLIGLENRESARTVLENVNLKLGEVLEVESDKPEGSVVGQITAAGTEVDENSTVDIEISVGAKEQELKIRVEIPYIDGIVEGEIFVNDKSFTNFSTYASDNPYIEFDIPVTEGTMIHVILEDDTLALYEIKKDSEGKLFQDVIINNVTNFNDFSIN